MKNIYAKMSHSSMPHMATKQYNNGETTDNTTMTVTNSSSTTEQTKNENDQSSGDPDAKGYSYIDVYSYTLDMESLRTEVNNIVKNYLIKMTNKLGNNIYYFSELPSVYYRDANGKFDQSKAPETLHFTMKQFFTNRSFKNLFGKNIDIIRKRVEFFRDNKDWYDNKGVPYTLGILVSGSPGSGKTSVIKCIANELKRHIINIHLSDNMTKTQIENLFYSEQIHVTQNGRTDTYTIPINKRIYVLEDVDCQCDVVLDRGQQSLEQVLLNKNKELKDEIERLKFALSEMANGKRMVVTGNDKHLHKEEKKDENANQKITLSFLLNLFDGVLETPGRITFMTTNFIDKLDKAFTRPGRIDVISKFGFADNDQLISIIEHRYDTKLTEEQIQLVSNLHQCITPAEISRILFENFDNLEGALESLSNYTIDYLKKESLSNQTNAKKEEHQDDANIEKKSTDTNHKECVDTIHEDDTNDNLITNDKNKSKEQPPYKNDVYNIPKDNVINVLLKHDTFNSNIDHSKINLFPGVSDEVNNNYKHNLLKEASETYHSFMNSKETLFNQQNNIPTCYGNFQTPEQERDEIYQTPLGVITMKSPVESFDPNEHYGHYESVC
jgi:DNA replication protein DnaC